MTLLNKLPYSKLIGFLITDPLEILKEKERMLFAIFIQLTSALLAEANNF